MQWQWSTLKEKLGFAALLLATMVLIVLAWELWKLAYPEPLHASGPGLTYAELSSIVLTAATAILAVGGIALAVASFWGYREIRNAAQKSATDSARRATQRYLKSPEGRRLLENLVSAELPKILLKRGQAADALVSKSTEPAVGQSQDSVSINTMEAYPENGESHSETEQQL